MDLFLMQNLSEYLNKYSNIVNWDGHIHLFNTDRSLSSIYRRKITNCVGFADIEFDNIDLYKNHMIELYNKYIKDNWDQSQILLATAPDPYEAINIYEKFPKIIKGFGEIKLYSIYKGIKIEYKKISYIHKLCKYLQDKGLKMPIYIHYSLTNKDEVIRLKKILKSYPLIPIVLCHCGMDKHIDNKSFAYYSVIDLMNEYDNLWVDISYTALDYFNTNPLKLFNMKKDRLLIGSDINLKNFDKSHKTPLEDCENIYAMINNLSQYCNFDSNLKKLFEIKI